MALAVGALFVAQRVLLPGGVGSAPEGVSLAWSLLLPEEARAAYDALDAAALIMGREPAQTPSPRPSLGPTPSCC